MTKPSSKQTIEERLRKMDKVALYDSTLQGGLFLMSMLARREDASTNAEDKKYWRKRWQRIVAERKALPYDDPVAILAQQDVWHEQTVALRDAEKQALAA